MSEPNTEFKVGDVVILKSGGPDMTIEDTWRDGGRTRARCAWFVELKKLEADFDVRTLLIANPR
jgi:uncharacterized protein YodC (DUF2158 family)